MNRSFTRFLPAAIPYLAVLIGLYGFSSIWIAMGLYHSGVMLTLITGPGSGWRQLLRGWSLKPAVVLLLVCALNGIVIYLLFPLAGTSPSSLAETMARFGVGENRWVLLFIYYVTVTPWLEELFWRGRLGSDTRFLAVSDVLFGGYHVLVLLKFLQIPWVLLGFALLVAVAWVWRQVRRDTGGLLVPVLSHMAADASTMFAVHALIF